MKKKWNVWLKPDYARWAWESDFMNCLCRNYEHFIFLKESRWPLSKIIRKAIGKVIGKTLFNRERKSHG